MVRTSTHKLIFRSDPTDADHDSELYDLVKDPRETKNVYHDEAYKDVRNELKEKLFIWYFQTSDVTPWKLDPRDGGLPFPFKNQPIDFAMDTQESVMYHAWHDSSDSETQFIQ